MQNFTASQICNFALLLIQFFDPCNWLTRLPWQTVPNIGEKVVRNVRRGDQVTIALFFEICCLLVKILSMLSYKVQQCQATHFSN